MDTLARFSEAARLGDGDEGLGEDFSDMEGASRAGGGDDNADEAWAEALLEDLDDEDEPAPAAPPPPKTRAQKRRFSATLSCPFRPSAWAA